MKINSSRKKLISVLALALGIMIFAGAAFANYSTANGYEVGKNALKGLMKNENYIADGTFRLTVDENDIENATYHEVYDRNGEVSLNSYSTELDRDGETFETREYVQDGDSIYYSNYEGDEHTSVRHDAPYTRGGSFDVLYEADQDESDAEMIRKVIRFVELAGDTFVGDLKNNVVYVSGDDESATYELNLNSVQIPELVNAGLSVIFSSMAGSTVNGQEQTFGLGSDPIVDNVYLKFTVDNQERLLDGTASVTISGNGREARADMSLKMSYGNAQPERVDIYSLPNMTEYGYSQEKGTYPMNTAAKELEEKSDDVISEPVSAEVIGGEDGPTSVYVTNGDETEGADRVDEDGNVIDPDGNIVGEVKIQENGEGKIEYFAD